MRQRSMSTVRVVDAPETVKLTPVLSRFAQKPHESLGKQKPGHCDAIVGGTGPTRQ
jgi:hypothetical protein